MSRNQILAVGALLWSVAILDGLVHLAIGAEIVTFVMVVAGIAGASLIAVRRRARLVTRHRRRLTRLRSRQPGCRALCRLAWAGELTPSRRST